MRRLDRQVKTASQAIRTAVGEHGTTLTQMYGVGPVLAAKLLGHAGDITRFPDRDHFASYTGTAPVDASSGDVRRHRLNRGGNRQLNTALHLIAVCQIRDPSPGQAYYRRKLTQAKTPEEARRSLKRHLVQRRLQPPGHRSPPPHAGLLTHRGAIRSRSPDRSVASVHGRRRDRQFDPKAPGQSHVIQTTTGNQTAGIMTECHRSGRA